MTGINQMKGNCVVSCIRPVSWATWREISWTGGFIAFLLLVASCATTKVDVLWSNPDFAGRKIEGRILIVGLTQDPAMRRVYEDDLSGRLAARGLNTLKSYAVVEGVFGADGNKAILEAARREGATVILSSAVVGHEHIQYVSLEQPVPRWRGGYDGWYSYYWPYLYRRADVRTIERYFTSTSITDVASGNLRWTARTHTDATNDADRDIREFAGVLIDALGKSGLL